MKLTKGLLISMLVFMSTSVMAFDQIKCIKYQEGDQIPVEAMIRQDLQKAAKTPADMKMIKNLRTDTLMSAGYVMYCMDDHPVPNMMQWVGGE